MSKQKAEPRCVISALGSTIMYVVMKQKIFGSDYASKIEDFGRKNSFFSFLKKTLKKAFSVIFLLFRTAIT